MSMNDPLGDMNPSCTFDINHQAAVRLAGRAKEAQRLLTPYQYPQQLIESDEMVYVGVRDKDVADAKQFAGTQGVQITEIEQQRPAFEHAFHVERRISKWAVDQLRMK